MSTLIYESPNKVIYLHEQELYKGQNKQIKKLDFKEFIREIDTCPDKSPEWKRETILKAATQLGYFGNVA